MTNRFETLKQELINKGIINDNQTLHSVHDWGYIIEYSSFDLDLYDNTHQFICSINTIDDRYTIDNNILRCTRTEYCGSFREFVYDLSEGAPIHEEDVAAIFMKINRDVFTDRVIILKDGMVFIKIDGKSLEITDTTFYNNVYLTRHGYTMLSEDCYKSNINIFNDLLVTRQSTYTKEENIMTTRKQEQLTEVIKYDLIKTLSMDDYSIAQEFFNKPLPSYEERMEYLYSLPDDVLNFLIQLKRKEQGDEIDFAKIAPLRDI